MKPVKSVSFNVFLRLFVLFLFWSLASCGGGSYTSTAPGTENRQNLAALEAVASKRTTDDTVGYVFSDNFFTYQPCVGPGVAPCPETLTVGNPVHSYAIDLVSGMPSPEGVKLDSPPANTKSVTVAPSGRFMYLLTGDNLLYTLSIGYSYFTEAEFIEQNLNPLNLYNAVSKTGAITGGALSSQDMVSQLNSLLEQPDLYDQFSASNPNLIETTEIKKLKTDTIDIRTRPYGDLAENEQKSILRLNRLMVELAYPTITPVNKGVDAQHVVGTPVTVPGVNPPSYQDSYKSSVSIEMEPLGKFVYVLGRSVEDGKTTDPITGVSTPILKPALSIYSRDVGTGQLTLSATQILVGPATVNDLTSGNQLTVPGNNPYRIGRLIFASSGLFAYGSNNGTLHTFSVDQSTGSLNEVGTPFQFRRWISGDPFHNIAADPAGKFLYLMASSGNPWVPPPPPQACPEVGEYHQMGSLIYTFVVDAGSGLLTLAGPPLDTTPHIMTSVSVDPKGRFVQLLNTYEHSDSSLSFAPDVCTGGINTSQLNVGAIYSNYVDQASGKLISSGSLQAGGAQMPTGFVAAGLDSVSLTGDVSGRFLYLLNSSDMYVYNVDQANGALTAVGSPLTGATKIAMPGTGDPVVWPSVCYTDGVFNNFCSQAGSRSHSLTWAGY